MPRAFAVCFEALAARIYDLFLLHSFFLPLYFSFSLILFDEFHQLHAHLTSCNVGNAWLASSLNGVSFFFFKFLTSQILSFLSLIYSGVTHLAEQKLSDSLLIMGNNSPPEGTWFSQGTNPDTNLDTFDTWTEKDEIYSDVHKRTFASDKYLRGSVLGQGGWSIVYKIQRVEDGKILAGKASTSVNQLYKETKMLRTLSHVSSFSFFPPLKVHCFQYK